MREMNYCRDCLKNDENMIEEKIMNRETDKELCTEKRHNIPIPGNCSNCSAYWLTIDIFLLWAHSFGAPAS